MAEMDATGRAAMGAARRETCERARAWACVAGRVGAVARELAA